MEREGGISPRISPLAQVFFFFFEEFVSVSLLKKVYFYLFTSESMQLYFFMINVAI